MPTTDRVHRASAQRRRAALLDAAAELSAELGAGAVTHRAVAARAGVPLSTTSYFFSSIDELITEALRRGAKDLVDQFDAVEKAAVFSERTSIEELVDDIADTLVSGSRTAEGSQVEFYLAAGRQPELQADASALINRLAARLSVHLDRAGAAHPDDVAWAMQALIDGAMLHRLANIETEHRDRLAGGLRLLMAASMLTDTETDELLARFPATAPADLADATPA